MPSSYRVFLGAPSVHDIGNDPNSYSWRTTSSNASTTPKDGVPTRTQSSRAVSAKSSISTVPNANADASISRNASSSVLPTQRVSRTQGVPITTQSITRTRTQDVLQEEDSIFGWVETGVKGFSQSFVLPKATLEEASRRISMIYRDLVFRDLDLELSVDEGVGEEGQGEVQEGLEGKEDTMEVENTGARSEPQAGESQEEESGLQTSMQGQDSSEAEVMIPGFGPATKSVEVSVFRGVEQTTLISWPSSNSRLQDQTREDSLYNNDNDNDNDNDSFAGPSFLLDATTDASRSRIGPDIGNTTHALNASRGASQSHVASAMVGQGETQTETQALESQSFGASYSDASSIGRFPAFHFSLHSVTPLGALVVSNANANANANAHRNAQTNANAQTKPAAGAGAPAGWHGPGGPPNANAQSKSTTSTTTTRPPPARKVNLLLAVLEVDGPDAIRLKKGSEAGTQVSVLKLILGDEAGDVVRLTAWRETAEEWGYGSGTGSGSGGGGGGRVKRGDVVFLENVNATLDAPGSSTTTTTAHTTATATTTTLTASPFLKSKLVICYRTLPSAPVDARLRPDLRLGISEPSVRKVAGIVQWFEQMAGIA